MKNYELREMLPDDIHTVLDIFRQGIESGMATFQTTVPTAEAWDMEYHNDCRWILEDENQEIVGWCALKSVSKRDCYQGVAEISIYFDNDYQRKGLGSILLKKLILDSEDHGFWTLQANVFLDNQASVKFHQKNGFKIVGVREKLAKLNGIWKDVILLERRSKVIN